MKWKKLGILMLTVVVGTAFLAGCGSSSDTSSKKELTYSKSQGPYSDLFEKGVKPILEKKAIPSLVKTCLTSCRLT